MHEALQETVIPLLHLLVRAHLNFCAISWTITRVRTLVPFGDAALIAALELHFHYPAFRPGQLDALHHVLARRDLLVVMPTGSGKCRTKRDAQVRNLYT